MASPKPSSRRSVKKTLALDPQLKAKTSLITRLNKLRCTFLRPIYGTDLHECLRIVGQLKRRTLDNDKDSVLNKLFNITSDMIYNYDEQRTPDLLDVLDRFLLYIPPVVFATRRVADLGQNAYVRMRVTHPHAHALNRQRVLIEEINQTARMYVSTCFKRQNPE